MPIEKTRFNYCVILDYVRLFVGRSLFVNPSIFIVMNQLKTQIERVNEKFLSGLNDDDAVAKMIAIDKKTKGYTYLPRYDTYELITDLERLQYLSDKYGYWSTEVEYFNSILTLKGGWSYLNELNNQVVN